MDWKDLGKTVVGKGIPLIGGLMGGSAGERVGNIVAGVLGVDSNPDTVLNRLEQDPEAAITLQKYEYDHREELQKLELAETQAYLNDRQSAREREAAVVKATGKTDKNVTGLMYIVTFGFFIMLVVLSIHNIPEQSSNIVYMLIGALSAGWTSIISYYFGSSKGSKEKDMFKNI